MCAAYIWAVVLMLCCGQAYGMLVHQSLPVPQRTGCFDLEFRVIEGKALELCVALLSESLLPWPQPCVYHKVLEIQSRGRDTNGNPLLYGRLFYGQGSVQFVQFYGQNCFLYKPFSGDMSWYAHAAFKPYLLPFVKAYEAWSNPQ